MALYNISTYSQYTEVLIGFMSCHTTSNLPPNCSNNFSYAYFRVLFLACDGRRRGDPNGTCITYIVQISIFTSVVRRTGQKM